MDTARLYTKFGYDISRCRNCGLVYANPRAPREAIFARYNADDFWKEYLPALGVEGGRYDLADFDARYSPILTMLAAAPGRRLVEIGSGAGFFLKAAERAGWRGSGFELSAEAARFAREQLRLDVRHQSAELMDLGTEEFHAAAMFDTIEHLVEPRAVLESVARALVPGGLLIVSTPNFGSVSRHLLGVSWAVLSPLEHMYYFEERTLSRLIETCGFDSVRFARSHASWGPQQTVNFRYTQAPEGWRARGSGALVLAGGVPLARAIQRCGWQDILLCVAKRPR